MSFARAKVVNLNLTQYKFSIPMHQSEQKSFFLYICGVFFKMWLSLTHPRSYSRNFFLFISFLPCRKPAQVKQNPSVVVHFSVSNKSPKDVIIYTQDKFLMKICNKKYFTIIGLLWPLKSKERGGEVALGKSEYGRAGVAFFVYSSR